MSHTLSVVVELLSVIERFIIMADAEVVSSVITAWWLREELNGEQSIISFRCCRRRRVLAQLFYHFTIMYCTLHVVK